MIILILMTINLLLEVKNIQLLIILVFLMKKTNYVKVNLL